MNWNSMETAPRDGSIILTNEGCAHWDSGRWILCMPVWRDGKPFHHDYDCADNGAYWSMGLDVSAVRSCHQVLMYCKKLPLLPRLRFTKEPFDIDGRPNLVEVVTLEDAAERATQYLDACPDALLPWAARPANEEG